MHCGSQGRLGFLEHTPKILMTKANRFLYYSYCMSTEGDMGLRSRLSVSHSLEPEATVWNADGKPKGGVTQETF